MRVSFDTNLPAPDRCPALVLNGVKWKVLSAPTVEIGLLADKNEPLREFLYDQRGHHAVGAGGCLH